MIGLSMMKRRLKEGTAADSNKKAKIQKIHCDCAVAVEKDSLLIANAAAFIHDAVKKTAVAVPIESMKKSEHDSVALKSLEPLFLYFKMVCESEMPFPGKGRIRGSPPPILFSKTRPY